MLTSFALMHARMRMCSLTFHVSRHSACRFPPRCRRRPQAAAPQGAARQVQRASTVSHARRHRSYLALQRTAAGPTQDDPNQEARAHAV